MRVFGDLQLISKQVPLMSWQKRFALIPKPVE
jgi:hypothetical protein